MVLVGWAWPARAVSFSTRAAPTPSPSPDETRAFALLPAECAAGRARTGWLRPLDLRRVLEVLGRKEDGKSWRRGARGVAAAAMRYAQRIGMFLPRQGRLRVAQQFTAGNGTARIERRSPVGTAECCQFNRPSGTGEQFGRPYTQR